MRCLFRGRKTKSLVVLTMMLFGSHPANAGRRHPHCGDPVTYHEIVSSKIVFTSDLCAEGLPLTLVQGTHQFSFGVYTAEYWQGSYDRAAEKIVDVRYDTYNCFGRKIATWFAQEKTDINVSFDIDNSNLRVDATWIDIKAPMTDDEAKTALSNAKKTCELAK